MDEAIRAAHIDESGTQVGFGRRLYLICASLTRSSMSEPIQEALRGMCTPGRPYLHYYDETPDRRRKIASCVATIPLDGAIVAVTTCADTAQEDARRHLLAGLLPRLQHEEGITHVIVESRSRSDLWDRRTVDRLRRSRDLTSDLKVDHRSKAVDPLLWVPDFVAGCWIGAHYHGDPEPWQILDAAHMIDVRDFK